jgi:WD40 repeat protein
LWVVVAGGLMFGQTNAEAEKLLEAARRTAVIEGSITKAIEQYERVAERYRGQPAIAAQALLEMGALQERAGQAQARRTYERILSQFGGAAQHAGQARSRLAQLGASPRGGGIATELLWDNAVDLWGTTSADGRFFSYSNWGTGDVAVRDLVTNQSRSITNKRTGGRNDGEANGTAMSPDGMQVAFTWNRWDAAAAKEGQYELRVVATDGRNERTLIRGLSIDDLEPQGWTPDGRFVVAVVSDKAPAAARIVVAAANGSTTRTLVRLQRAVDTVCISPDGRFIAFHAPGEPQTTPGTQTVFTARTDVENGTPVPVVENATIVGWMPDGRLLVNRNRNDVRELWLIPIRDGRADGAPVKVESAPPMDRTLGITPGGAVVYGRTVRPTENAFAAIDQLGAVSPPVADRPVAAFGLGAMGGGARFSPDGAHILYMVSPTSITIRSLSDGSERTLVPQMSQILRVEWSPDSRSLLISGSAASKDGLYRVDMLTGAPTLLFEGSMIGTFAAASDGTVIYYRRGDGTVTARQMPSGIEQTLVDEEKTIFDVRMSRDGRRLLLVGLRRLRIVDLPSGAVRVRYDAGEVGGGFYGGDWAPDGQSFVVHARGNELWRVPTESGDPIRFKMGATYRGLSMSPDGRRVAMMRWGNRRQVWRVDNLLSSVSKTR